MKPTPEQIARSKRAGDRAREVLKVGDRLRVARCAGTFINVTMTGWDGHWITSRMYNDIAPVNVVKVNGKPVDFGKAVEGAPA